jgi:hypothetical protein
MSAATSKSKDGYHSENDRVVTIAHLKAYGLTVRDVRRLDPAPVEYVGLDKRPCWLRDELLPLLDEGGQI